MKKFLATILFVLFLSANGVYAFGSINAAAYRPMYQNRPSNMYRQPSYARTYGQTYARPAQMPYWKQQSSYELRTRAQSTLNSNAQNLHRNYSAAQQRSPMYGYRY